MSIFKRRDADVQQTLSPEGNQVADLMPPFAPPGVVPPPAAPMYSMRLPQPGRVEGDTQSLVAEKVRVRQDGQQDVQERLRVALQRSRTASPAQRVRRTTQARATRVATQSARQPFDPVRCAQAGLLNLAWSWQEAGAPIRAIHAYVQVLCRYPDTPAAAAAVADLVELSDTLVDQGHFHIALGIYEELEQLL